MKWRLLVWAVFFACFGACGESNSPLSSMEGSKPKNSSGLGKTVAGPDKYMREFQNAHNEVLKILRDLKRYVQKGPADHRHADKVRELSRNLNKALQRLGDAFKNVRSDRAAQAAVHSLASDIGSVMSRLKPYNLSFLFMVNPCAFPYIGEYLCRYAPR